MSALDEAKARLALPELMARIGLADNAKRSAKCPFHEDRNNSFSVYQRGGEWFWKCHAGCGGGDAADLLARLDGLGNGEACKRLIELSGEVSRLADPAPKRSTRGAAMPLPFPTMPDAVRQGWNEGVNYLFDHPTAAVRLAAFRSWPIEFAQHIIDCAAISMPLYHNERGVAFQVVVPEGPRHSMTTRPIGYHIRIKGNSGEKASWRFLPNDTTDGQSIPALPYIIGDFESASLLVITEGQWDALTFALAAGWLGDGCLWPSGVGVIGIRGASGVGAFLKYYRPFWPASVNCLVLADADEAGRGWHNGEHSFAQQLAELGATVAVIDCAPRKDFNDLYRAERPGPEDIRDLLAAHGMSVESEVTA
jgi:DNA primase (bacterial type)